MKNRHHFTTKNLVTIALLSGLGAALSTYVGYLGHVFGSAIGLPVGGQLLTGLHVFWLILVLALVDKKGAGLLAAVLDNVVQFLMGSHLGIFVLPVGLLQGLFAELGYWPLKRFSRVAACSLAGGLSSWSNLLVIHFAFNMYGTKVLFQLVSVCAFVSGVVFAGLLPCAVIAVLRRAGLLARPAAGGIAPENEPVSLAGS